MPQTDVLDGLSIAGDLHADGNTEISSQPKFVSFTSTNTAANSSVSPSQNYQASGSGSDSLTELAVTSDGTIVRGDQEATISFTAAQINAGFGGSGLTIISAPGANKYVVILDVAYLIITESESGTSGNVGFEVRQANATSSSATTSVFTTGQFNRILKAGGGIQSRDVPVTERNYLSNKVTTIHKINNGTVPSGFQSMKVKIKYRLYDESTF